MTFLTTVFSPLITFSRQLSQISNLSRDSSTFLNSTTSSSYFRDRQKSQQFQGQSGIKISMKADISSALIRWMLNSSASIVAIDGPSPLSTSIRKSARFHHFQHVLAYSRHLQLPANAFRNPTHLRVTMPVKLQASGHQDEENGKALAPGEREGDYGRGRGNFCDQLWQFGNPQGLYSFLEILLLLRFLVCWRCEVRMELFQVLKESQKLFKRCRFLQEGTDCLESFAFCHETNGFILVSQSQQILKHALQCKSSLPLLLSPSFFCSKLPFAHQSVFFWGPQTSIQILTKQ